VKRSAASTFGFCLCLATPGPSAALQTAGALFVSDAAAKTVARFPLVDDIPIGTPAGVLSVSYVPGRIAASAGGVLYVADPAARSVNVYAAGAAGHAAPLRSLTVTQTPLSLALDAQGYTYVGEAGGKVEVYAPGAAGKAIPVSVVSLELGTAAVNAVHVDNGGRLFGSQESQGQGFISEYGDPRTAPTFLRGLAGTGGEVPFEGIDGLATDESGELYVSQSGWPQVWAFDESACCAYPVDRLIVARGIAQPTPTALAVRGRHAFILTGSGGAHGMATPEIVVADVLHGVQTPLETISGSFFHDPIAVAVTP
jgi:hypothetical protein